MYLDDDDDDDDHNNKSTLSPCCFHVWKVAVAVYKNWIKLNCAINSHGFQEGAGTLIKKTLRVCLDTVYLTENWKHCSKINFKCVNSAIEPIFNEKVAEKWSLWDP